MEQEPEEAKAGAPEWMVTFADLMSLLLTFFVLLLSFSNTEIIKFRVMAGSVRNALGMKSDFALSDIPTGEKLLPYEDPKQGEGKAAEREKTAEELREMLEKLGLGKHGEARVTKRGVVLQLSGDLLFESGAAQINKKALPILDGLAAHIVESGRLVDILGHTDNVPIATQVYPSNWELSAARAGQAVRYLAGQGVPPVRMRAIGQAHSIPIAGNDTAKGRAANRRVEFVLVDHPEEVDRRDLEELVGEREAETGGKSSEQAKD